jgi:hypothetical protein
MIPTASLQKKKMRRSRISNAISKKGSRLLKKAVHCVLLKKTARSAGWNGKGTGQLNKCKTVFQVTEITYNNRYAKTDNRRW